MAVREPIRSGIASATEPSFWLTLAHGGLKGFVINGTEFAQLYVKSSNSINRRSVVPGGL
jgi:hypothetical protein